MEMAAMVLLAVMVNLKPLHTSLMKMAQSLTLAVDTITINVEVAS